MLLLIFIAYLALMVLINYQTIVKYKTSPHHEFNGLLTIGLSTFLAAKEGPPFAFYAIFYLYNYWFLFDTFLNIVRKLPIQYIGKTAIIDKVQRWLLSDDESKFGMIWVFKAIIFLFLVGAYFLDY